MNFSFKLWNSTIMIRNLFMFWTIQVDKRKIKSFTIVYSINLTKGVVDVKPNVTR